MKKKHKANASEQPSSMPKRFGLICALLDEHKAVLPEDLQTYYDEKVSEIYKRSKITHLMKMKNQKSIFKIDFVRSRLTHC